MASIIDRFPKNEYFYADLSILHPRILEQIRINPGKLQVPIMNELNKVLMKFDSNAIADNFRSAFAKFISNWDCLKITTTGFY